jgi:hypothetical protein
VIYFYANSIFSANKWNFYVSEVVETVPGNGRMSAKRFSHQFGKLFITHHESLIESESGGGEGQEQTFAECSRRRLRTLMDGERVGRSAK